MLPAGSGSLKHSGWRRSSMVNTQTLAVRYTHHIGLELSPCSSDFLIFNSRMRVFICWYCVCWVPTEGGLIDFWPHVSSPENPLIAFVLLPVSLSSVSLPLMKLQMNWPPPSCLSPCARSLPCRPACVSSFRSTRLCLSSSCSPGWFLYSSPSSSIPPHSS